MKALSKLAALEMVTMTLLSVLGSLRPLEAQETTVTAADESTEVLTRGPIHEAFAEQYNVDPTPGITVAKRPPEPITEVPPEQVPEGENVVWIPGYWAWDDEAERHLWISGLWRVLPPDQRWVPGYWAEVDGGFQWISGFWTAEETGEINYLPQPPESLENGPNVAMPSEDYFWVPGCWLYDNSVYQWRPGYWAACYDDWIWVPERFVWTPHGCILVNGYWDYRLPHRGVLFAPVSFHHDYYATPFVRYTPSVVVDTSLLLIHLFVRPRCHHYYFGDYYDHRYSAFGISPWHGYHNHRRHYDPVFTYYKWHYGRHGMDIAGRMRSWHDYFERHEDHRPPHTLAAQINFAKHHRNDDYAKHSLLSRRLDDFVRQSDSGHDFHRLGDDDRQRWSQSAKRLRGIERDRLKIEIPTSSKRDRVTTAPTRTGTSDAKLRLPELSDVRHHTSRSWNVPTRSSGSAHTEPRTMQPTPNTQQFSPRAFQGQHTQKSRSHGDSNDSSRFPQFRNVEPKSSGTSSLHDMFQNRSSSSHSLPFNWGHNREESRKRESRSSGHSSHQGSSSQSHSAIVPQTRFRTSPSINHKRSDDSWQKSIRVPSHDSSGHRSRSSQMDFSKKHDTNRSSSAHSRHSDSRDHSRSSKDSGSRMRDRTDHKKRK